MLAERFSTRLRSVAKGCRWLDDKATSAPPQAGPRGVQAAIKRLVDVVGSTLALLLFAPVMALAAVLIKLDTPGPVFFK